MESREEREIRIFDLFITVCQRWRSLLLCLLIGAVLVGAYGWYKSGGEAPVSSVNRSEEEILAAWADVLGPDDMNDVEQLFASISEYDQMMQEHQSIKDLSERLDNMDHMTAILNNISLTRSRFSSDQKAYLAYLMGDTDIVPGNASTYDHKANVQTEKEMFARNIDKKFVILGALLGLVLAVIAIIIKYVASVTLKSAAEVEEDLALPVFGRFDGSHRFYDKRHTKFDRWLRKIKQRNPHKTETAESVAMVAAKLQIAAQKNRYGKVCLLVDSNVETDHVTEKAFLQHIGEQANHAPEVLIGSNLLGSAQTVQTMSDADAVLLVFQTEKSRFTDVVKAHKLCESYSVPVLGAIVVE